MIMMMNLMMMITAGQKLLCPKVKQLNLKCGCAFLKPQTLRVVKIFKLKFVSKNSFDASALK